MKNQKMQNGTSIRDLSKLVKLFQNKLEIGKKYSLRIFTMEKLDACIGVYQDHDLIYACHLSNRQLNAILSGLSFSKEEMYGIIFKKEGGNA